MVFLVFLTLSANSEDPDQLQHGVFDLGLYYLPMSHKKDAKLIWVKDNIRRHIIIRSSTENL